MLLRGPSGIGKTTLLAAALRSAEAAGFQTLLARASEFERGFGFGVVRQLVEPAVATAPDRESLLAGVSDLARGALGLAREVVDVEGDAEPSYGALNGLQVLAGNLAARAPLAIAVDDVQWADAASLRALGFIARRVERAPIVLLLTLRPEDPADARVALDELVGAGSVQALRPAPLSRTATARLVAAELPAFEGTPDDAFAEACHSATGGNPLYVRELLADLRDRHVEPVADAAPTVLELGPGGLSALIVGRLERLGPDAVALARACAVLGDDAAASLAGSLAELDEAAAHEAAHRLALAEIVRLDGRVAFSRPITRAAVLAAIEPARRAGLHTRAAALLRDRGDPDQVATHLLGARPAGDPRTVATLREAAARAGARGAPEAAVALLTRALAEPPEEALHTPLLHELGVAEARVNSPAAEEHLRAALERTAAWPARGRIAAHLAWALNFLNRPQDAVEVLERALGELGDDEDAGDAGVVDLIRSQLADFAYNLPDYQAIVGPPPAQVSSNSDRLRLAYAAIDAAKAGESEAEAADLAERALEGVRLLDESPVGISAPLFALLALTMAGRESALRHADVAVDAARELGTVSNLAGMLGVRAGLHLVRGSLDAAEADIRSLYDAEAGLGRVFLLGPLLGLLVEQERWDEAEAELDANSLTSDIPDFVVYNTLLHSRGRLRIARGLVQDGLDDVLLCGRRQEASGVHNPANIPWRSTAALALSRLGRREEAEALAQDEVERARRFGAPGALGLALLRQAQVTGDAALVAEAIEALQRSTARLELARALVEQGRVSREGGEVAAARKVLARAQALAEECGAGPVARRAAEELVAAGGRPRRQAASGIAALTPSERRVSDLAAQGCSNREIAERLVVTETTVEGHLRGAYRKLGIRSRTQLGAALA